MYVVILLTIISISTLWIAINVETNIKGFAQLLQDITNAIKERK